MKYYLLKDNLVKDFYYVLDSDGFLHYGRYNIISAIKRYELNEGTNALMKINIEEISKAGWYIIKEVNYEPTYENVLKFNPEVLI